ENRCVSICRVPQIVHCRGEGGHAVTALYGECIKRPAVADNRIGQVVECPLEVVGRVVKAREEASEPLRRVPCRFTGVPYIVHLDAKSVQNYLLRLLCNGEVIERTVEGICLISGRLHSSVNVLELKLKGFFYGLCVCPGHTLNVLPFGLIDLLLDVREVLSNFGLSCYHLPHVVSEHEAVLI